MQLKKENPPNLQAEEIFNIIEEILKIDFKKVSPKTLKINDKNILKKVKAVIDMIENTTNLMEIKILSNLQVVENTIESE